MAHDLKSHPLPATARRLLHVDLADGSTRIEPISHRDLNRFVRGPALAAATLCQLLPPATDPLGPANIQLMAPGALTGAPVPGSDPLSLAARSSQTQITSGDCRSRRPSPPSALNIRGKASGSWPSALPRRNWPATPPTRPLRSALPQSPGWSAPASRPSRQNKST